MFKSIKAIWWQGPANHSLENKKYNECIYFSTKVIKIQPSKYFLGYAYSTKGHAEFYLGKYNEAFGSLHNAVQNIDKSSNLLNTQDGKGFVAKTFELLTLCKIKIENTQKGDRITANIPNYKRKVLKSQKGVGPQQISEIMKKSFKKSPSKGLKPTFLIVK